MIFRAVDNQGFAGGFTLGVVQAGFHLVAKREMKGGFGVSNCEANRHLLGYCWNTEAVEPMAWTVPAGGVELVFGNPPCSGFSGLSSKHFRGIDSPVNECMWALVDYAARVRPEVVVFESVRTAYSQGLDLMRALRMRLEDRTAQLWNLYHVKHDAHALGGPSIRRRYFWVASRIRFGVEHPKLFVVPIFNDVIADLEILSSTWEAQPYRSPPTAWSRSRRSPSGLVDGHQPDTSMFMRRVTDLMNAIEWPEGTGLASAARRYYEIHGNLPKSWAARETHFVDNDFNFGFNAIHRWDSNRPGRVITGAGPTTAVHPRISRSLTHREVARVMGFPDDWLIYSLRHNRGLSMTWGKGVTVDAGRWIATWIRRSLEGSPGDIQGVAVGDREWEINVSKPRVDDSTRYDMIVSTSKLNGGTFMTEAVETPIFSGLLNEPQVPAPVPVPVPVQVPVAVPGVPEVVAETAVAAEPPVRRRGRPYSTDVAQRDERVFTVITQQGMTRGEIAKESGLDETKTYQSLWRLHRDNLIIREGRNWRRAA